MITIRQGANTMLPRDVVDPETLSPPEGYQVLWEGKTLAFHRFTSEEEKVTSCRGCVLNGKRSCPLVYTTCYGTILACGQHKRPLIHPESGGVWKEVKEEAPTNEAGL